MPTGYTAQIEKGSIKTPKDFLRICLRNFGICYAIQEDDIPLSETDLLPYIKKRIQKEIDFYEESFQAALTELAWFDQLSDEDLYQKWKNDRTKKRDNYMKFYAEDAEKNKTYDRFSAAINAWDTSTDFKNIKDFALDQIRISKNIRPEDWLKEAEQLEDVSRHLFDQIKDEIRMKYRKDILWTVNHNREMLEEKKKKMTNAVDFYIRFEHDIKDIRD